MATLPELDGYRSIEINSIFPGTQVETDTGKVYRLNYGSQYFKVQIEYPTLTRNEARQVIGFLQARQGNLTEFDLPLGMFGDSSGARATLSPPPDPTLNVASNIWIGESSVDYTSQWSSTYYNSATHGNFLNVGDYFKFANHPKVYQITAITNPDSIGSGSFEFSPPLQANVAATVDIEVMDVKMTAFLDSDVIQYSAGLVGHVNLALNLREDI